MKNKIISILLLGFMYQIGFSQTIDTSKLDQYLEILENNNKFMGSVALLQDGKVIYTKAIGYSDVETKTKPDKKTKYRIGSISKTFTSTLVFKAIEENKLSLETKLAKYFPGIKNASKITISNLLNHRSGIHNFTNDEDYLKWSTQQKSQEEMVQIIKKAGSDFKPDSKAEYSNSNYVLLSYILEQVYEKSYSEVLTEKIISPIGLKNTSFGSSINLAKNEANSYSYNGEWVKQTETDMSVPMGAGGVISTPSDLTLFADALFSNKIISSTSVAKMKTLNDNYGMGLFQMPFNEKKALGHTGSIDGFSSMFGYFIDEKVSFALTSNGRNYETNNIAIALLSAVFNKSYEMPSFKVYELSTEDLDPYLGTYSSKDLPLKITISKEGKVLIAQATGQSSFRLEATEKAKFKFEPAGVVLEFSPADNSMVLKQGGGTFNFVKEK